MKHKPHVRHYLFQTCLGTVYMIAVLCILDHVSTSTVMWAIGASSLASSTFIVFTKPHAPLTETVHMIGAYLLSILIGMLCAQFNHVAHVFLSANTLLMCAGAIAVGLTIFLMSYLRLQHPPAVGIALVLAIEPWKTPALVVIISGVIILGCLKHACKYWMQDL